MKNLVSLKNNIFIIKKVKKPKIINTRIKNIIKYTLNLIYFIKVVILDIPIISDNVFSVELFSFQVVI